MAETIVARKADEGTALWMLGGLYDIKVSSEESGGAVAVVEFTIPVGMGPPPHRHDQAETMYVLEGRANLHINGETVEAGPGSCFYFPPGTTETFEPIGPEPVKLLGFYTPGGMDTFFTAFGDRAPARTLPPTPTGPPDLERLVALGREHGLEIDVPQA